MEALDSRTDAGDRCVWQRASFSSAETLKPRGFPELLEALLERTLFSFHFSRQPRPRPLDDPPGRARHDGAQPGRASEAELGTGSAAPRGGLPCPGHASQDALPDCPCTQARGSGGNAAKSADRQNRSLEDASREGRPPGRHGPGRAGWLRGDPRRGGPSERAF